MKGYVKRDENGKIIIDNNGFITITCEDDSMMFQLHLSEIDEKAEQMCFNVNGKDIYIDVYPGWETSDNDPIAINENDDDYKTSTPSTSKSGNMFPWCDASTKIFLKEYKLKKELVKNRKLKNMKRAYQEISKSLQENGFNVSPLQVENRFKTLKRAYKNMIINNRRTGRGRYICSYEQDLDEIFCAKDLVPDNDELNGEANVDGEFAKDQNASMRGSSFSMEAMHNFGKNVIIESTRLEAQHAKIIENLQNCQRVLKTLATKMDNRIKTSNDLQQKMLQVCTEMCDMQREAYARAEEQRQKDSEQREKTNNLLEEFINLLQNKKEYKKEA